MPKPNLKAKNKSRPDTIRVNPLLNLDAPSNNVFNDFVPNTTSLPLSKTIIL